ncbi:MAG: serine hydrolase [Bacteroidota bacterium]|nr:serine hydrolase [Bacteroidota bacterium]
MRGLFAFIPILLLFGCTSPSGEDWHQPLDAFIRQELASKGIPALSIAIVADGQEAWVQGYGLSNPATGRPVTPTTVYRVASVSKLFTALAVMQQVEQGLLELDAPITDWLPEFRPHNPFGKPVTLRQLLSHRSGLVREPPVGHYFDATSPTLDATVASLNNTSLILAPESRTKYSNAAVSVAGFAIEKAVQTAFHEHAQSALVQPMGLRQTSFSPRSDLRDSLGIGYMWRYDTADLTEAPVFELGIGPAANLYTSVRDLGQFINTLFAIRRGERPDILSSESLHEMWTIQFNDDSLASGFGLGFSLSWQQEHRRVQHAGVMYGYATRVYALPDESVGVAVVANLDAVNPVVDRIAAYALDLLLAHRDNTRLPEPPLPATFPVDSAVARAIDGHYEGDIALIERSGRLYIDKGAERFEVLATRRGFITEDRLGHGYAFQVSGDSLIADDGIFLKQTAALPDEPPPHWAGLIGEYGWNHNVLYIYEDRGRLYALIEWFFRYPLEELSADRYRFPSGGLYVDETLTFRRNAQGQATRVSLEGLVFDRRTSVADPQEVFRITSLRPVDELRAEALAADMPEESGPFRPNELVDLASLDSLFRLDVRYAGTNNFMGAQFYTQQRVFLQWPAADALLRAHQAARDHGYGFVLYDGYRPWHVTKMFYDATPEDQRLFVANPANGSRHNRGAAIDLGLYHLDSGQMADMVSGYDEFTARAFPDYPGGTSRQRFHRELLRDLMEDAGFSVYEAEWWHFDFAQWRQYSLNNFTFEELEQP